MIFDNFAESWDYPKEKALCFTGHRPDKIKGYSGDGSQPPTEIKKFLEDKISDAINDGYLVFYNGLAKGIDLWAAEIVLEKKKIYPQISLIGVQPYPDHGKSFSGEYGKAFKRVFDEADMIICTGKGYHRGAYHVRDRFMADHSSRLIGVCNMKDTVSGTHYTINYAKQNSVECLIYEL